MIIARFATITQSWSFYSFDCGANYNTRACDYYKCDHYKHALENQLQSYFSTQNYHAMEDHYEDHMNVD